MKTRRPVSVRDSRSAEQHAVRMLDDGYAQACSAIEDAGWLIWNSIQKLDGDPRDTSGHAPMCGCVYCN